MLKKNLTKILLSCLFTVSPIAFGLIVWNKLPAIMSTHWGIDGAADGASTRAFAVFGLPLILLAVNILCMLFTALDKSNKNQNPKAFNIIFFIVPTISIFANAVIYSSAFGKFWNYTALFPLVIGLLFIIMGNLMPKVRRNSTLGFRLKWTLESEAIWNATHRFGGKIMVTAGILILITAFLPVEIMFIAAIALIVISLAIVMIFSYRFHKAELENGYDEEFEPIYNIKAHKIAAIISIVLIVIIIGAAAFIMVSGNIYVTYTDDDFTVDSDYYDALTLSFTDISNVDFYENMDIGSKEAGFNSAKLSIGKFTNDELGSHTRYTYNNCSAVVVIESDGKLFVINASTEKATKEIYSKILSEVQHDSGFITGEGEEI